MTRTLTVYELKRELLRSLVTYFGGWSHAMESIHLTGGLYGPPKSVSLREETGYTLDGGVMMSLTLTSSRQRPSRTLSDWCGDSEGHAGSSTRNTEIRHGTGCERSRF